MKFGPKRGRRVVRKISKKSIRSKYSSTEDNNFRLSEGKETTKINARPSKEGIGKREREGAE